MKHLLAASAIAATLLGCGGGEHALAVRADPMPAFDEIRGRDPVIRWAGDGSLHMVYVDGEGESGRVMYRRLRPRLEPARVVSPPGARVSSHGEVPPTVEILGDGTSVVFYTVALPGQWVGEIHMQRSTDGGSSWSAPVAVHDDEKRASHSFFSTHLQNDGRIVVAWLDGRGGKPAVYATTTSDGLHVEPNGLVDEKACECCGTELETSSDGSVLLAYRDLEQDNVRDIALASARPSSPWRRLGKVSNDNWSIEACPHSGARLTRTGDGSIWAAWSSGADGSLFVAASRDGGKTFSARQRIGGGQGRLARHPEIAELSPGRIIIAYERPRVASSAGHGGHDTRSEIVTRIFDGRTWSAEHDLGDGSYPRIARSATGTVLSFTRWRAHSPSIVVRDLLE